VSRWTGAAGITSEAEASPPAGPPPAGPPPAGPPPADSEADLGEEVGFGSNSLEAAMGGIAAAMRTTCLALDLAGLEA